MRGFLEIAYLLAVCTTNAALSDCIDGHENGAEWNIEPCRKCHCMNGIIMCSRNCDTSPVITEALNTNMNMDKELLLFLRLVTVIVNDNGQFEHQSTRKVNNDLGSCNHDGTKRRENESWHDLGTHSNLLDTTECMQCQCRKKIVMCTIRKCPELSCSNPIRSKHSCCPTCPESAIRPEGCFHSSSVFPLFSNWKVYIPVDESHGRCVTCICSKGFESYQRICENHPCPPLNCDVVHVIGKPGQCCGFCAAGSEKTGTSNTALTMIRVPFSMRKILNEADNASKTRLIDTSTEDEGNDEDEQSLYTQQSANGSCNKFDKTRVYQNMEKFTPAIDLCLRCMCEDSAVSCKKVICPSQHACLEPQFRTGLCCKVCPGVTDETAKVAEERNMQQLGKKSTGCSRSPVELIQVYKTRDPLTVFKSKFLFYRTDASSLETHTLEFKELSFNIDVNKSFDISTPFHGYIHMGSIKQRIMNRVYKLENEMGEVNDSIRGAQLLHNLKKMLEERARKKRFCKSPPIQGGGDFPLQEVG